MNSYYVHLHEGFWSRKGLACNKEYDMLSLGAWGTNPGSGVCSSLKKLNMVANLMSVF